MTNLHVKELTVEFSSGGYAVRPIDGLSFEAPSGSMVLLLGPSGSGKTTLLSALAGILTPTSGEIMVGDTVVNHLAGPALVDYRKRTVGIVFQAFNLIPSLTALENVEVPLRIARVPRHDAKERARHLLERVGLKDRMNHRPGNLSGGQQQRVAIARALAHDPPLVIADEPTAHLDYIQVETVLLLLRELSEPGRLLVVSTHDDRMIPLADRVIEMAPRFTEAGLPPEHVELPAGAVLFRQGARGERVYFVEQGEVEVYRELADGGEERLAVIDSGKYFGELAPMLGTPRSASARARTDATLTSLSVRDFKQRTGISVEAASPDGGRRGPAETRRGPKSTRSRSRAAPQRGAARKRPARTPSKRAASARRARPR